MSTNTLFRLAGFAALINGALAVASHLGAFAGLVPAAVDNYRALATILLNLFVLSGLYAVQSHQAGLTGLVGYVVSLLGLAGNVGLRFMFLFVAPILSADFPEAYAAAGAGPFGTAMSITFITYALGFIIFGIAIFRAGVFPRWAGALLALGALLSYLLVLPLNIGGLLVSFSMAWLGWSVVVGQPAAMMSARPQLA